MAGRSRADQGATDAEQGLWKGRSVARAFVSRDGLTILVGRSAEDNDILTFKLASQTDFWLHVASGSGSHVVVRNADRLPTLPRATKQQAASLAARYSQARRGGRVAVHVSRCRDVGKGRGMPPGKVTISRYRTVFASPAEAEEMADDDG
jgi:predicted ribosome quality control (RQC) complex YloA/Tae2 family protein